FQSGRVPHNLSNDLGLLLFLKGDGRTYQARLTTNATFRGMDVSFAADFETVAGDWMQVKVPWTAFTGSFRGMSLPDKTLEPSQVQRVAILIGDKKQAPFSLEVGWIRTYGKGQGEFKRAKAGAKPAPTTAGGPQQIIPTSVADGRFTTLKTALDAAGLTPFFQWDNPLTVFAPTDEAFAKLAPAVLEDLLLPENKKKLVSVLSYHVVTGDNRLPDALSATEVKTIEGSPLKVVFSEGKVKVNDATLVEADIDCSDGVIHVVDTVLLPPSLRG
ncbi:MAG: CIA30 family protein, partial [Verrucomicrobiota bacterium]